MKTISIRLTLLILAFSLNAFAQAKLPKTALDFFALLPAEYMTGTRNERLGTADDFGYTNPNQAKPHHLIFTLFGEQVPKIVRGELKNPVAMGDLKVFQAKTRTIIGLMFRVEMLNDKNKSPDKIKWYTFLLEYKAGKWKDVTAELMPKVSVEEGYKYLTENLQIENLKKENIRIEPQINPDKDVILMVARSENMENQTVKLFKWNGLNFVEMKY